MTCGCAGILRFSFCFVLFVVGVFFFFFFLHSRHLILSIRNRNEEFAFIFFCVDRQYFNYYIRFVKSVMAYMIAFLTRDGKKVEQSGNVPLMVSGRQDASGMNLSCLVGSRQQIKIFGDCKSIVYSIYIYIYIYYYLVNPSGLGLYRNHLIVALN